MESVFLIHVPQVRFLPGAPRFTSLSNNHPFVKIGQNQSNGAILNAENSTEMTPDTLYQIKKEQCADN